jgi:short-subunit dehydrogenase
MSNTGTVEGSCHATAAAATTLSSLFTASPLLVGALMLCAIPTILWLSCYLLPQIYMCIRPVPDLKKKYTTETGQEWALVTGAGSGIGKSISMKCAAQGLNVVLVSLDDDCLKTTMKEIQSLYPKQQFRAIGVNFTRTTNYMDIIQQQTKDISISILFNNAGFIVTGFVDQVPIEKLLLNIECNAVAAMQISHYFVQKLIQQKKKGCIVFTSSVAAYIPSPFAAMYSATKAFVSTLASSMHIECAPLGIDVIAIHPSPVASNFYNKLDHKVDLIEAAAKNAALPDHIVNDIFRSIGSGSALRDLGTMAWCTRIVTFMIPMNTFVMMFTLAAPYLPDWKTHNQHR